MVSKELQTITVEEIKTALLEDSMSEKSELFQLLCTLSTAEDADVREKIVQIRTRGDDYLKEEVKLFFTN